MEEYRIWLNFILLAVLISISAFFSASETSLTSLKHIHMNEVKEKDPKKAGLFKKWFDNPNEFITAMLLGNNIVNTGATALATAVALGVLNKMNISGNQALMIITVIMTVLILIFGEITPKIIAKTYPYQIAKNVIFIVNAVRVISTPFVKFFMGISKFIARLFGVKITDNMFVITEEDIKSFVNVGKDEGVIEEGEQEMIHSIFEFSDTTVREILTPRTAVFALEAEKTLGEVWQDIIEQGFSRIPIYDEQIDNIIGILYLKDLIKYDRVKDSETPVKELIREAYYVPATKTLVELLEEFRNKQNHMAIILDEYGGTLGIITIEDLLEEIVGEIRDEFDQEEENIKQIKETLDDIKGETGIEDLNQEIGIDIPLSEEYETVSGFIQSELGRVAELNDQIKKDNYILKVLEIDNKRIDKVRVILPKDKGVTDGNTEN